MPQELSTEDIAKIIDRTSDEVLQKTLSEPMNIHLAGGSDVASGYKKEKITQIIESSTEEKIRKEQSDILTEEIKKRFARLKKISKENYNMLEVALLCHKLSNDYKRLAKINQWSEIETLFD
jgi:hypothetical protein